MSDDIYETPKSDLDADVGLTGDNEIHKRPIIITIICIIGFIGGLVSVPLIFSDIASSIGSWYPPYLGLSVIIGFACFVGFWQMRKIAAYTYAGFVGINQVVMLSMGVWNIGALLIPGIIVIITFSYLKKMR
ncbi:hypothetical protein MNBD_GAMMA21-1580 [hydrothermal vent metagenome]|uniref:Uncharacterized protein n=1 Tax=hydrothermal vent metagenome TaxID=652676 RepID=A0A3B0ZVZ4_9ZZZZ